MGSHSWGKPSCYGAKYEGPKSSDVVRAESKSDLFLFFGGFSAREVYGLEQCTIGWEVNRIQPL